MPIPPSLSPDSDLAYAKDILARLERYAASVRVAPEVVPPAPAATAAYPTAPPPLVAPPVAAPPDDILPVSVPWPYPSRTDAPPATVPQPDFAATGTRRRRIDPATADLFPYDLAASIVACALTIMVNIAFGRAIALGFAVALAVAGEWMRRTKWFPSIGVKILIGTVVGLILLLTA